MAPSTTANGKRAVAVVPRPIVPAIPLQLTQKRRQARPEKAAATAAAAAPVESNGAAGGATPAAKPSSPGLVNGAQLAHSESTATTEPREASEAAAEPDEGPQVSSTSEDALPTSPQPSDVHPGYQMPPPFRPAGQESTPSSAASLQQPPAHPDGPVHHGNRSNGSIAFGGCPKSHGSVTGSTESPSQYPPQMQAYMNAGPYQPSGRSSYIPEAYPAYMDERGHPDPRFPAPHGYEPHGHERMSSFVPPEAYSPFSPTGTPEGMPRRGQEAAVSNGANGASGVVAVSEGASIVRGAHCTNGASDKAPSAGRRAGTPDYGQGLDVTGHLLSQFGVPDLADCDLQIRHVHARFEPVTFPLHGLLLAQSPYLRSRLEASSGRFPRGVAIATSDRFLTVQAFTEAVRTLYGATLGEDVEGDGDGMAFALGYAAAGHLLLLEGLVRRGVDLAARLLSWETVEQALAFAMDGGLDVEWAERAGQGKASEPSSAASTVSTVSSPTELHGLGVASPTYGYFASALLHPALDFVIQNFPADFSLDPTAPPMALHPRLPQDSVAANVARLSAIRFGDHPAEDSDASTTTLSTVLLSLPFPLLKHVLEHARLGGGSRGRATRSARQKAARDVVDERERRRTLALRSAVLSARRHAEEAAWEAVGWKEGVVSTYGGEEGGVELTRRWRGIRGKK
ncbi:MAG: hypothetical protein M1832_002714 [Thelocarpon impressellum]|nr:MAG: hypothetical protein M1832_002714 [Thelocarpon impressellum]